MPTINDDEFNWEWLKHSDHLFGVRSGLFLVGETILLTVMVNAAIFETSPEWVGVLIGHILFGTGTLFNAAWLCYCHSYSVVSRKYISERAGETESRWAAYQEYKATKQLRWTGVAVAYAPAVALLAFWILVWIAWGYSK